MYALIPSSSPEKKNHKNEAEVESLGQISEFPTYGEPFEENFFHPPTLYFVCTLKI